MRSETGTTNRVWAEIIDLACNPTSTPENISTDKDSRQVYDSCFEYTVLNSLGPDKKGFNEILKPKHSVSGPTVFENIIGIEVKCIEDNVLDE